MSLRWKANRYYLQSTFLFIQLQNWMIYASVFDFDSPAIYAPFFAIEKLFWAKKRQNDKTHSHTKNPLKSFRTSMFRLKFHIHWINNWKKNVVLTSHTDTFRSACQFCIECGLARWNIANVYAEKRACWFFFQIVYQIK